MATGDDRWASSLLNDWLQKCGMSDGEVSIADNDPPDLTVSFRNGDTWGVEITRVYHRIEKIGSAEIVDSASVMHPLEIFGQRLGDETKAIRQQSYSLILHGSDGIDARTRRPPGQSFKEWKSTARANIIAHIHRCSEQVLEGPGFTLKPSGEGSRWSVMISSGTHELSCAASNAVSAAFHRKLNGLQNWRLKFDRKSLILLNCYVLVDDESAVSEVSRLLEQQAGDGFDSVFWSGCINRSLQQVTSATDVNPARAR